MMLLKYLNKMLGYSLMLISLALIGSLLGCSKRYDDLPGFSGLPFTDAQNYSVGRFKTTYLADQIHAYYRGSIRGPIAVATFVELDDLYGSSSFGRLLSEQLMSELSMKGYNVIELRKSDALQIMTNEGELALSRDIRTLRQLQDVSGIVVGTYVASPVRVYLNVRLIDPASSLVISAGSVEMGMTREIAKLLRTSALPQTLERIPVRHIGYSGFMIPYSAPWPYNQSYGRGAFEEDSYPAENQKGTTDLPLPKQGAPAALPSAKLEPTL